jgi:hypothetical protein
MPRLDIRLTLDAALSRESQTLAKLLLEVINPVREKVQLLPLTDADLVPLLTRVLATPKEG